MAKKYKKKNTAPEPGPVTLYWSALFMVCWRTIVFTTKVSLILFFTHLAIMALKGV